MMKKTMFTSDSMIPNPKRAFAPLRLRTALSLLCLAGVFVALVGMGAFSSAFAQGKGARNNRTTANQASPGTQTPDVVRMIGPVALSKDLRDLPYIPQPPHVMHRLSSPHPHPNPGAQPPAQLPTPGSVESLVQGILRPLPTMPPPLLTFDGTIFTQTFTYPPDPNGDVGPNHYVQSVNTAFRVFDKSGNPLTPLTTMNSFFAPLTGTPCGSNQNCCDPFVFYDHIADRWLITDFAPLWSSSGPFYECIGVSQTGDPVTGGWFLYAVQTDPGNPSWFGDYPKFALWNNPQPGGAYYFTVSLEQGGTGAFEAMRVFALDRGSMLTGGPANAIAFSVPGAAVPDTPYFFPAGFRTGNPPPVGRDEFVLAIDWPANGGVIQTHVHGWLFHADFINPANSTFGVGPDHLPNAEITVNPFVDAFNDTTEILVPQQGTSQKLDTIGPIIMPPVVYQNRSGTESLWADHTILLNYPNGPTAIRWYQFNVTGGVFPATPAQQQDWTNGGDGLWRWLPSIALDQDGNTAIGYSTSSPSMFAGIRYAGRLATDPPNDLGQGEAIMTNGGGAQLNSEGRWGDYSTTTIDPTDGVSFWHTNEYYTTTANMNWHTRVGKFDFAGGGGSPTPTPTATPTATPCQVWVERSPVPYNAGGIFAVSDGLHVYAGGGADVANGIFHNDLLQYDPANNTWTPLPPSPDYHYHSQAVYFNGNGNRRIYNIGGYNENFPEVTDTTRIYDIDTGIWTTGAPIPQALAQMATVLWDGVIYVAGGNNSAGRVNTLYAYHIDTNTWTTLASMPEPVTLAGFGVINGKLYIAGGSGNAGYLDTLYIYDIAKNTWIPQGAHLLQAIARPGSTVFNDGTGPKLYLYGGRLPDLTPTNITQIYNPAWNTWSYGPNMNVSLFSTYGTAVGNNSIVAPGGFDANFVGLNNNEQLINIPCGTSTPTPTPAATATPTPSATPTVTPTSTPRPSPTPRPRPTPARRP